MKDKTKNKLKDVSVWVSISLALAIFATIGITIANLVINTERRANSFTVGRVEIDLTEKEWDNVTSDERIVYPGRTVKKDPKVTNLGKNDAYVYLEVQVPREKVRVFDSNESISTSEYRDLFTFEINTGWTLMNSTVSGDSSYKTIVYAYTAGVLEPQKTTPALFDTVKYVEVLEGEIEQGKFLDMPINAVAIQADYLDIDGSNLAGKIKNAYEKYRLEAEK